MRKQLKTFFIYAFLIFLCEPIAAEVTHLKENMLIFSRAGGFADSGTDIYTVNNKGIKIMDDQGDLGKLLIREPEKAFTPRTISDRISLPQPSPNADIEAFSVVVGDYYGQYMRLNENTIEAMVSENNTVTQSSLKIQDDIGEVWIGTLLESETGSGVWNNPTMKIVPTLQGGLVKSYVGIGHISQPQAAVHVSGNLRIDNGYLIGPIGLATYDLNTTSAATGSNWTVVKELNFSAPLVRHGAALVGVISLTKKNSGITEPQMRMRIVDVTDGTDQDPYNTSGVRAAVYSAINKGRFESGWSDDGTFSVTLGFDNVLPDTYYQAQIEIRNANTVSDRSGSITSFIIPIETISESDIDFPEIDRIGKQDPNITSAESEDGNYITEDKIAFESGGRVQNVASNLFVVNKEGEYYPFKAGAVEASEIHQTSILRYVRTDPTALYDFIIQNPSNSAERLEFGLLWNASSTEMEYITSNIQVRSATSPAVLTLKGDTIYLADGAMTLDTSVTVNKPKLEPEDPDMALDIDGDIMVEQETQGGAFYVDYYANSTASSVFSSGTHTIESVPFAIPDGNNYELSIYVSVSIEDNFNVNTGIQLMDVWLEGTDAAGDSNTKAFYSYEEPSIYGVHNKVANYTMQSVKDVTRGTSFSFDIKVKSYEREFIVKGVEVLVVGLPKL